MSSGAFSEDQELIDEFKRESIEALNDVEPKVMGLSDASSFKTNYDEVFRVFHSVKGGAGMFEMNDLQSVVHHLEALLTRHKEKGVFPTELVDYLLKGGDVIRDHLEKGVALSFKLFDPLDMPVVPAPTPIPAPAPAPQAVASVTQIRHVDDRRPTVFIVDDEVEILEVLRDTLDPLNVRTEVFSSGINMLERLQSIAVSEYPDCVITDINMPEMTGIQMVEKVKSLDADLPVIFVSGYVDKNAAMEAVRLHVDSILEKPFSSELVCAAVRRAISLRRFERLLERSIKFILYQYSDLDAFLKANKKEHLRASFRSDLQNLMEQMKALKAMKKAS